jgi:16S rRNA (guanine1207-N2)-methyltransferase
MKDDHYFSEKPSSAPAPALIKAFLRGRQFTFHTSSGVFSKKGIDRGTQLLIERMEIKPRDRVLDLGCGYGPIGIVAAHLAPAGQVVMTDVNKRAVKLARKGIRENGIENAEVRQGDLYEPVKGEVFDVILCNLPMSAGLDLVFRIIRESGDFLVPGGASRWWLGRVMGGSRPRWRGSSGTPEPWRRRGGTGCSSPKRILIHKVKLSH